jgi:Leucine-rich repeat (LRR) protein
MTTNKHDGKRASLWPRVTISSSLMVMVVMAPLAVLFSDAVVGEHTHGEAPRQRQMSGGLGGGYGFGGDYEANMESSTFAAVEKGRQTQGDESSYDTLDADGWAALRTENPTQWLQMAQEYYGEHGTLPGDGGGDASPQTAGEEMEQETELQTQSNNVDPSLQDEVDNAFTMAFGEGVSDQKNSTDDVILKDEVESEFELAYGPGGDTEEGAGGDLSNALDLPFGMGLDQDLTANNVESTNSNGMSGLGGDWFSPPGNAEAPSYPQQVNDPNHSDPNNGEHYYNNTNEATSNVNGNGGDGSDWFHHDEQAQLELSQPEQQQPNVDYNNYNNGQGNANSLNGQGHHGDHSGYTDHNGRNRTDKGADWFHVDEQTFAQTKGHNSHGGQQTGHHFGSGQGHTSFGRDNAQQEGKDANTAGFDWTDRQVLEYLYQQAGGDNWKRSDSWLEPTHSICLWYGVRCRTGREEVTALNLSSNGLKGLVPMAHLLTMEHLQEIKLDGNSIDLDGSTGGLTEDAMNSPSALRLLDLRDSGLSRLDGIFLDLQGDLRVPNLRTLRASRNSLSGPFPGNVLMMNSLETLELDFNDMTGFLPIELAWMSNMEYLSVESNKLKGTIPDDIATMQKLRSLMLQNNKLTGSIPGIMGGFPELEKLDVSQQQVDGKGGLTGHIPSLNRLTKLSFLDMSYNSLGGSIPSDFLASASSTMWFSASINENQLTGTIPASLGRFDPDKLLLGNNFFDATENGLCEQFSSGLCSDLVCEKNTAGQEKGRATKSQDCEPCPSGTVAPYLGMTRCFAPEDIPSPDDSVGSSNNSGAESGGGYYEGTGYSSAPLDKQAERDALADLYENCGGEGWSRQVYWMGDGGGGHCDWQGITCNDYGSVISIRLSSNGLKGTPSASLFANLPRLTALFLNGNQVQLNLSDLSEAQNLETLDLTSTGLYSLEGLEAASSNLKALALASNALTGEDSLSKLWQLTSVEELVLDYNHFGTAFPSDISKLASLKLFSCAGCGFTGEFPAELVSLTQLTHFRLEDNFMTGNLDTIAQLTQLETLDLSNQISETQLSGPLPSFEEFHNLRRIDLSYNSLTGAIPTNFLAGIVPAGFESADVRSNIITGNLPGSLAAYIHKMDFTDNEISSIEHANCENIHIANYGCDGVMCEPGTASKNGRQSSVFGKCEPCPQASFFGAAECDDTTYNNGDAVKSPPDDDEDGKGDDQDMFDDDLSDTGTPLGNDRDILQSFFLATEGLKWTAKNNWLDNDVSICTWYGIKCADQVKETVEAIELKSNNLHGRVPSVVFELPELKSLLLDGNEITLDFGQLYRAQKLRVLDLSNTHVRTLEGLSLKGETSELTDLHLASTKLSGPFPMDILSLKQLERLTLDYNSLTGSFPLEIDQLKRLTYLSAQENQFDGSLPASLGGLSELMFLTMQNNALSGTIPDSFKALTNLWFLDMSHQEGHGLTGPLPSFNTFTQLKRLDFSQNALTGEVPSDFLAGIDINLFEYADLSSNKLKGILPGALNRFGPQTYFFQDNEITGIDPSVCTKASDGENCNEILCPEGTYHDDAGREDSPDATCDVCSTAEYFGATFCGDDPDASSDPQEEAEATAAVIAEGDTEDDRNILEELYNACGGPRWYHSTNWLTDASVCDWHGIRCADDTERVAYIMLSANNLVGTPPASLFDLVLLDTLVLDSNEILFKFEGIENAQRLETLDISSTGLSSLDGIEKASSLTNLHAASNNLQGVIPSALFTLTKMERITLDFNAFSGPLPSDLNNLKNLKLFSAADNLLTGQLPDLDGASLDELQTLRLQLNAFRGSLPASLGSLTSITILDLSDQENDQGGIAGQLIAFENWSDIRRLDLSGNALMGSVPPTFLRGASTEFFEFADLTKNQLSGEVSQELAPLVERLYLQDNEITSIAQPLCDAYLGGSIAEFACDAILCPKDSFNERGKQDSPYFPCTECLGVDFMGSTTCPCLEDPTALGCESTSSGGSSNEEDTGSITVTDSDSSSPPTFVDGAEGLSDRAILEKFYNTCGGYYWWKNDNWLDDDVSICEWYGVKCVDNNRSENVQALHLGANNVKHTPPPELFLLPQLGSISLYSNPEVKFSFQGIAKAKGLTHLALDATGLTTLNGIGNAPNLVELEARFNKLSGIIPEEITQIKTLRRISLSHNEFEAPLPDFAELSFLEDILLSSNKLEANLGSVQLPSTLKMLDLSDNAFSGIIPPDFLSNVPDTTDLVIDLSNNQLTGNVPSSLGRFDEMTIKLRDNQLSVIDEDLCEKSNWNGGDVGRYKCDGILCPEGQSSSNGRQNSDEEACIPCRRSNYLGGTVCSTNALASTGHRRANSIKFVTILVGMGVAGLIV